MNCPKCNSERTYGGATFMGFVTSDNWVDSCADCGTRWTDWQMGEIDRLKAELDASKKPTTNSINDIAKRIVTWRISQGFMTTKENMLGKLMLVVTECAEAAEDVRNENWDHFGEEIADAMIRLMDIRHTLGYDLNHEIERKMAINEGRPYMHGTKSTL